MKLQFDPNQQFQLDAVSAVADLFDGQPRGTLEFSVIKTHAEDSLYSSVQQSDLGAGNQIGIDYEKLLENLRAVQERNDIDFDELGNGELKAWEIFDAPINKQRLCPHFSIEMETGTGKTYVYLRTIFDLHQRYGFAKFLIVVPSVAIREGVLKNLEITAEHLKVIYNQEAEHFVYDSKRVSRLRHFATGTTLQIGVINIQAFNKDKAVIYKEMNQLSGHAAIEFIQAARPIVIIDEPQSVEGGEGGAGIEALKELNPLCTLRFSATHRNPHNIVYRLDPVRAFELRLVKQIVVASAVAEGAVNDAFVRVEQITHKPRIQAKLRILKQGKHGPKEASVTVRHGADLHVASDGFARYAQGHEIAEIDATPGAEFVRFSNGRRLRQGEEVGGVREDVWKLQIHKTVEAHLKKEAAVREGRVGTDAVKVLSLFFIDRVANYRDYGPDGQPIKGKFALEFESLLAGFAKDDRFKGIDWLQRPAEYEKLHNGYFSQDKKGIVKDTSGSTQADDDTYTLIMKDKERLLSDAEPLRFIFSHSALREGWDNPNVFQICTLNETTSAIKKRQEIGRGLRLPVDASGKRVFDDSLNKLYVMANESYEEFARTLQKEYADDCGVIFGKVPLSAMAKLVQDGKAIGREAAKKIQDALVEQKMLDAEGKIQPGFDPKAPTFRITMPDGYKALETAVTDLLASYQIERHIRRERDERTNPLKKQVVASPEFLALWDRIKPRTTYRVEFDTEDLIRRAVTTIKVRMPKIEKPKIRYTAGGVMVKRGGVETTAVAAATELVDQSNRPIPDVLAYLQNETELTRSTIFRILKECGRLDEFFNNPQRFLDEVAAVLKHELHTLLVDGIKYEKLTGTGASYEWEQLLIRDQEVVNYLNSIKVNKSVHEYIEYDSDVERKFAEQLDQMEEIKLFIKLPRGFLIDTPVGQYNPDWAILKHDGTALYLVRETKGSKDFLKYRNAERDKVICGKKHFEAIGVPFDVVVTAAEV